MISISIKVYTDWKPAGGVSIQSNPELLAKKFGHSLERPCQANVKLLKIGLSCCFELTDIILITNHKTDKQNCRLKEKRRRPANIFYLGDFGRMHRVVLSFVDYNYQIITGHFIKKKNTVRRRDFI